MVRRAASASLESTHSLHLPWPIFSCTAWRDAGTGAARRAPHHGAGSRVPEGSRAPRRADNDPGEKCGLGNRRVQRSDQALDLFRGVVVDHAGADDPALLGEAQGPDAARGVKIAGADRDFVCGCGTGDLARVTGPSR